eukprot:scaffold96189_cov20-Tisochrysis_lutea.AAC.1
MKKTGDEQHRHFTGPQANHATPSASLSSTSSRSLSDTGDEGDPQVDQKHRGGAVASSRPSPTEPGPHTAAAAAGVQKHHHQGQQPQQLCQPDNSWGEREGPVQLDSLRQEEIEPILQDNPERFSMFPIQ